MTPEREIEIAAEDSAIGGGDSLNRVRELGYGEVYVHRRELLQALLAERVKREVPRESFREKLRVQVLGDPQAGTVSLSFFGPPYGEENLVFRATVSGEDAFWLREALGEVVRKREE